MFALFPQIDLPRSQESWIVGVDKQVGKLLRVEMELNYQLWEAGVIVSNGTVS